MAKRNPAILVSGRSRVGDTLTVDETVLTFGIDLPIGKTLAETVKAFNAHPAVKAFEVRARAHKPARP